MDNKIEFFFDCSSPWTYLAFKEIIPLAERNNCEIIWMPILVGGIFNAINPSVYELRANPVKEKLQYATKDMADWAQLRGIEINWPDVFPVNSVKAMRGVFYAMSKDAVPLYVDRVFSSYWTNNQNISETDVLVEIVTEIGWDVDDFLQFIALADTKDQLKNNTQTLCARGGFGSPTLFLNKTNMFFGNDRLDLLERIIQQGTSLGK